MTQRVLLRLAFDGSRYHGTQRQPDVPTVNQAILDALGGAGLLAEDPRLRAQGRVDAGVSARDHPVAIDVEGPLDRVARTIAGNTDGIGPYAAAPVHAGFDPRLAARSRTYRYHLPTLDGLDVDALAETWQRFQGRHDVSAFARIRPRQREQDPIRIVTACRTWVERDGLTLEVTGRSFLRHQVRRMVGAAQLVARGELDPGTIEEALAGGRLKTHAKAPPDGLILWRVGLSADWRPVAQAEAVANRRMAHDLTLASQRLHVLDAVLGAGTDRP